MRILQISSARSIGGGERHVIDLSNELAKRSHEIFVAVVPDSPLREHLSEIPKSNIAEFRLRNALDVTSAVRIANYARDNRIDLINAHFAKDYPVTAVAARIARIPFVVTRHVLFPMNKTHRVLLRNVKYVIAPSNAVAKSLRHQALFPSEKIVTIRYGIDVDRFPERERRSSNGIVVGSIGNLDPVKGFDILIRAAAIVVKRMPEAEFKIVGEDRSRDGRNEKELRDLIDEMGVRETVKLVGWSDNVLDVLSEFDVFVSASRSESFGFVIAEAMLAGVPVIASETEGAREIISDPSLGQLVPIGSPEKLANAICDVLSGQREQLTGSARRHIADNFSLKRMVDETESLYLKAISSASTRSS